MLTTTATWRGARIRYDVLLDRANKRVGLVRLRVTSSRSVSVRSGTRERVVRTEGTRTTVAMVARLHTAQSGRTYEFSKVVGFATSLDALAAAGDGPRRRPPLPRHDRQRERRRLGAAVAQRHRRARPARSCSAASAPPMFYLLASARADVDESISPVGLSAGGYNNHVFWDAETWMYPALLAQHPEEASTVVDYRYDTRAGAARNAPPHRLRRPAVRVGERAHRRRGHARVG